MRGGREAKIKKYITKLLLLCWLFYFFPIAPVEAVIHVSDRLSNSAPGAASDHSITFQLTEALPGGGKIEIKLSDGNFFIEPGFDHNNVDLATASNLNGTFVDRDLATTTQVGYDTVDLLASSSTSTIDIVLDSSTGIAAGRYLNIELGSLATHQVSTTSTSSIRQIINPSGTGVYQVDIKTYDSLGNMIEKGLTMIVTIYPVNMGAYMPKTRSNGTPRGILTFGTAQTVMSLNTNYAATCRWSNTASTSYWEMEEEFNNTGSTYYHSEIISGFLNGTTYYYYVRCLDNDTLEVDTTDYLISFIVSGLEGEGGDEDVEGTPGSGGSGPGSGGGGGGGGGGGSGPGSGELLPFPELPGPPIVTFEGWAYPGSTVYLLKDGEQESEVTAKSNGSFDMFIQELPQGTYTFGIWSEDSVGRKSPTQSFTFYIREGTNTQLYDVYLPPTIDIPTPELEIGNQLSVLGESAAESSIQLWLAPDVVGGVTEDKILKYDTVSATDGKWSIDIDSSDFEYDLFVAKAYSSMLDEGKSEFSKPLYVSFGGDLPEQSCAGADLNGDGKVNITDFSILLYWWETDEDCPDQNNDGTVNLIDFSIMLFNWTG